MEKGEKMAEIKIPIVVKWEDIKSHLVLCKDCKYFAEVDPAEKYAHCPHMRETDFCSLGERREE